MKPAGKRSAGTAAAAILLPPLGVYLGEGPGRDFWIACLLTVVGFVPGVVFAVFMLFARPDRRAVA